MKLTKSKLMQIIKEEVTKFSSTEETRKDYMDPAIKKLNDMLHMQEFQTALEDVAISVIDQYTDVEGLPGRVPGEREAKYGKMTADEARKEISETVSAVFDNYLADFYIETIEQLVIENFPEEERSEVDESLTDVVSEEEQL